MPFINLELSISSAYFRLAQGFPFVGWHGYNVDVCIGKNTVSKFLSVDSESCRFTCSHYCTLKTDALGLEIRCAIRKIFAIWISRMHLQFGAPLGSF